MANTDHLADVMRTFSGARLRLREVYTSSICHATAIDYMKPDSNDDTLNLVRDDVEYMTFIAKEDEHFIKNVLYSDHIVIFCGQINCGKTSLINELLGGSYLPTSQLTCTARIVRIKYAEENYLQVYDEHGAPMGERITFKKKVPSEEIDLPSESRSDESEVKRTVEVGLNHPMLAHGLQIVDLPGLSESQALDNVVTKALDGRMQLLIYVIDGKNSLRTQDTTFISYLKNIAPSMDIIFVCNKVEEDLAATKADKWDDDRSDDDRSDDDRSDDGSVEESVDKAELAFSKLQQSRLIPPTQQYGLSLENYHGISCTRVREARMKNRDDEFTKNFNRFRAAMMNKIAECVRLHILQALMLLSMAQKRLCAFFVKFHLMKEDPQDSLSEIHEESQKVVQWLLDSIIEMTSLLEEMLQGILERNKEGIQEAVEVLDFDPIDMDDGNRSENRLKTCRDRVRDYILMLAIDGFEILFTKIRDNFIEEVKKLKAEDFSAFTDHTLKTNWVPGLRERVITKLTKYYEGIRMKGKMNLDTEWKVQTGLAVLNSIDTKAVAADMFAPMMNRNLQNFRCSFSRKYSEIQLISAYFSSAYHHEEALNEIFPDYCRNLVVTDALCTTLTHGAVTLGEMIGKGSRMEVFKCDEWNRNYNSRCGQSLHLVAKKEIIKSAHPSSALCAQYCRSRMMPDLEYIQKVTTVVYDKDLNLCIILPHYDGTLHDILMAGNTTLEQRMKICSKMIQLCLKASKDRFRLDDLRLNNFLVRNSDGVLYVCCNLSKWMDQLAPLPDGGVPFHFAPEVMRKEEHVPDSHDAYSMAVFILLMAIDRSLGRFVRPRWSESDVTVNGLFQLNPQVMANLIWHDFLYILETNWIGPKALFYETMVDVLKKYTGSKANRRNIHCLAKDMEILFGMCTNLDSWAVNRRTVPPIQDEDCLIL